MRGPKREQSDGFEAAFLVLWKQAFGRVKSAVVVIPRDGASPLIALLTDRGVSVAKNDRRDLSESRAACSSIQDSDHGLH